MFNTPSPPVPKTVTGFYDAADGLRYTESIGPFTRVFVAIMAVAMWCIPIPWLHHAHWGLPWWQLLLVLVVILACASMGLLFWCISLGRVMSLHWDATTRTMSKTSRLLWRPKRHIPYAQVGAPHPVKRDSEDGSYYVIGLPLHNERTLHLSSFNTLDEANAWCARISKEMSTHLPSS